MPETYQTISRFRIAERIRQGSIKEVFLSDRYQIILRVVSLLLMGLVAGLIGLFNGPTHAARAPEAFSATPTTEWIVTNLADTEDGTCDSDCSLREAISAAAPNDTIIFARGLTGAIILRSTLKISKSLTIDGAGTKGISISGNNAVRVFYVDSGVKFTIRNLTVTNGLDRGRFGSNGGQCEEGGKGGAASGGGLYNAGGSVTIINSTFSNSRAEGGTGGNAGDYLFFQDCGAKSGGAGGNGTGGALYTAGPLLLINSTFSDNRAEGGAGGKGGPGSGIGGMGGGGIGGALCATGTVFMVNCTFSGNSAMGGQGGSAGLPWRPASDFPSNSPYDYPKSPPYIRAGIPGSGGSGMGGAIYGPSDLRMSNCTLANNRARGDTADHRASGRGSGGAICRVGKLTIKNSIVAGSSSGSNCAGLVLINSEGYNIDSDGTCGLTATGDLSNSDPKLDSLKDNGGTTLTHALNSDSPAIDGGNPAGCSDHNGNAITIDQRGRSRPWGAQCDIGAYEFSR